MRVDACGCVWMRVDASGANGDNGDNDDQAGWRLEAALGAGGGWHEALRTTPSLEVVITVLRAPSGQ